MKSKSGGGRVDLDRFLMQIRRIISPSDSQMLSPAKFLSKLQQLHIPLRRQVSTN
jgi:hypothetical protein